MRKYYVLTESEAIVVKFHLEKEVSELEAQLDSGVIVCVDLYISRIEFLKSLISKLQ